MTIIMSRAESACGWFWLWRQPSGTGIHAASARRDAAITRVGTLGSNLTMGAAVEIARTPIPRRANLPQGVLKKPMTEAVSKDVESDNRGKTQESKKVEKSGRGVCE